MTNSILGKKLRTAITSKYGVGATEWAIYEPTSLSAGRTKYLLEYAVQQEDMAHRRVCN